MLLNYYSTQINGNNEVFFSRVPSTFTYCTNGKAIYRSDSVFLLLIVMRFFDALILEKIKNQAKSRL